MLILSTFLLSVIVTKEAVYAKLSLLE